MLRTCEMKVKANECERPYLLVRMHRGPLGCMITLIDDNVYVNLDRWLHASDEAWRVSFIA